VQAIHVNITISAKRLTSLFAGAVGLLILIHTVLQIMRFVSGDEQLMGLLAIFSLGSDLAIPAFYSAFAILVCSLLLLLIAVGETRRGSEHRVHWFGLSLIFLFLSIDEMLSFHERLIPVLRPAFDGYRFLYYGWVAPYAVAVIVFVVAYLRFLIRLPRNTAMLFVLAGSVYVGGAIGFEIIGGLQAAQHGTLNVPYVITQSIEEIMEMSGILVFLYALTSYAQQRFGVIELRLSGSETTDRPTGSF
jgi:hypothetical protein